MSTRVNHLAGEMPRPVARRMNQQQRILAIAFVVSFALDFKGAVGGSFSQFLMSAVNAIAFLLLAMSYRMALPKRGLAAIVFWAWLAFLLIGTLGAFVNSTPFEHYIRVLHPFALFLMGFLVVWWTARDPRDASIIVSAMVAAAIVSLLFTLWWGFHFTGVGLGEIRYQILSPLIPLLIVVAGYDFFLARQRRLWSIVLLSSVIIVIAISVTRGPILAAGLVAGIVVLVVLVDLARSGSVPRSILGGLVWGLCLPAIGILVAVLFYPEVAERWMNRALGESKNVTFWMRAAAVIGQYEALNSSWHGWFIGQGFGSTYPWPISKYPWVLPYVGSEFEFAGWFPGEFMWMPFLYYGGLVFGVAAPVALLWGAMRGIGMLGFLVRDRMWKEPQARPLWIGVLGYLVFLASGFSANPFILRTTALFMGMCMGMIVALGRVGVFRNSTLESRS